VRAADFVNPLVLSALFTVPQHKFCHMRAADFVNPLVLSALFTVPQHKFCHRLCIGATLQIA